MVPPTDAGARWLILAVVFLSRTAMGYQFQSIGSVAPSLVEHLVIDFAMLGTLIGAYKLPGTFLAYPSGRFGGRFGDKAGVTLGMALMTAGGLITAWSDAYSGMLTGRVIAGVGGVLFNAGLIVVVGFAPAMLVAEGMTAIDAGRLSSVGTWLGIVTIPIGGFFVHKYGKADPFISLTLIGGAVISAALASTDLPLVWFIGFGIFAWAPAGAHLFRRDPVRRRRPVPACVPCRPTAVPRHGRGGAWKQSHDARRRRRKRNLHGRTETMNLRKTMLITETVHTDGAGGPCDPITRVAALAVIRNPFARRFVDDLSELFDMGGQLGERLMDDAVSRLAGPPVSYGKAAIVGVAGDVEHGGAMIHPKLGKPMRAAVGGGAALIASNCKVAAMGTPVDLPLGHKDEAWSFDHFDTMTVMVADAPRPDEIVLCMAVADGGRPHPRVGSGPITD